MSVIFTQNNDFKSNQLKYSRVRNAYKLKEKLMKEVYHKKNAIFPPNEMYIVGIKDEKILELWSKSATTDTFVLVKTYSFCSFSGKLGPKRREGDGQIPEGVYYINRFNPASNFYLSLGLNYPNKSDRILGVKEHLGGDIFIHGDCVTIGCIPITDDKIMELYLIAVEAKNSGQNKIPVYLFPFKMTKENMIKYVEKYKNHDIFWHNLQPIYEYLQNYHKLPKIDINNKGRYILLEK